MGEYVPIHLSRLDSIIAATRYRVFLPMAPSRNAGRRYQSDGADIVRSIPRQQDNAELAAPSSSAYDRRLPGRPDPLSLWMVAQVTAAQGFPLKHEAVRQEASAQLPTKIGKSPE